MTFTEQSSCIKRIHYLLKILCDGLSKHCTAVHCTVLLTADDSHLINNSVSTITNFEHLPTFTFPSAFVTCSFRSPVQKTALYLENAWQSLAYSPLGAVVSPPSEYLWKTLTYWSPECLTAPSHWEHRWTNHGNNYRLQPYIFFA